MVARCKEMLEYNRVEVVIHSRHGKLITTLHTVVENGVSV